MGQEVTLKPRALPYGKVEEPRESASSDIHILLAGVVAPDLKDKGLREKFGGATPAETAKAIFLPGEIRDFGREIEKLCGYRMNTIEEVKTPRGQRRPGAWAGVLPFSRKGLDPGGLLQ